MSCVAILGAQFEVYVVSVCRGALHAHEPFTVAPGTRVYNEVFLGALRVLLQPVQQERWNTGCSKVMRDEVVELRIGIYRQQKHATRQVHQPASALYKLVREHLQLLL